MHKRSIYETINLRNDQCTKRSVYKTINLQNDRSTKRLINKRIDPQNDRFTKRSIYKTIPLQNVRSTKRSIYKAAFHKPVGLQNDQPAREKPNMAGRKLLTWLTPAAQLVHVMNKDRAGYDEGLPGVRGENGWRSIRRTSCTGQRRPDPPADERHPNAASIVSTHSNQPVGHNPQRKRAVKI